MLMFDPYYETKVNSNWGRYPVGSLLGILLVILGIMAVCFTIADLTNGMTAQNNSAWQENSIWPTIGKGIWVGAILITTGIIGVISYLERTQVSLYVFNGFAWTSAVFSLYLLLSSILHIQPYFLQGFADPATRTNPMSVEIIFNSLLLAVGALALPIALVAAILSCLIGKCCFSRRRYEILRNVAAPPCVPAPTLLPIQHCMPIQPCIPQTTIQACQTPFLPYC